MAGSAAVGCSMEFAAAAAVLLERNREVAAADFQYSEELRYSTGLENLEYMVYRMGDPELQLQWSYFAIKKRYRRGVFE